MEPLSLFELGWQAYLTLGVLSSTLLILLFTHLPSDYVFLGSLVVLLLSGVLETKEALAGFGSPCLVTIGVLYVVVAGMKETGGLLWISQNVLGQPKSFRKAQLRLMLPVSALSAFLNNTPVVALFIPAVIEWSRRIRVAPSRLLIPLSYASIFGGICTLVGTSTNLVVHSLVQTHYGNEGLSMFEITKLGLPCAVLGILFVISLPWLLPDRKGFTETTGNPREYTVEMHVSEGSRLAGKSLGSSELGGLPGAFVIELIREDRMISPVVPEEVIQEGDRLVFVADVDSMQVLYQMPGLRPAPNQIFKLDAPRHQRCLVQAVISNTCPLVGKSIKEGRFRNHYNAVVIAIARDGERIAGRMADIVLRPGDILLVEAHAGFIPRQRESRDFYLVNEVENFSLKKTTKAPVAFSILTGMVLSVSIGWLSMLEASLLAAGLMLATGCCSPDQGRRNIEWEVLLTIAAALGLGQALATTGAAKALSSSFLSLTGSHPWLSLANVYLITSLATAIITNNAAVVLIFPIAMNTAEQLGVNPMPFIICIMIAASASFATPMGYQTNLMVYGPGGYRFGDFFRIGLPLTLAIGAMAVLLAPLIWPFTG